LQIPDSAICNLKSAICNMRDFWVDVRYGLRLLSRAPTFTAVAVLTLALGIGANTAIFSVANKVLWSPLPYADADRLVYLNERSKKAENISISFPDYFDWKAQSQAFDGMALMHRRAFTLSGGEQPERLVGAEASWDFFPVLGVRPVLGRTFTREEDRIGADPTVVLSHALWKGTFGGDPNVAGRTLRLDNASYTIVGVMGPDLDLPSRETQLWVPVGLRPDALAAQGRRNHPGMYGVARLKPGVTVEQAAASLETIAQRLEQQYPENAGVRPIVTSLRAELVRDWSDSLLLLLGAVGLVLLIACANVAHLLLARAAGRRTEMAVRAALGAGRTRLLRQLLAEGLLLAGLGASLGLVFAIWGVDLLAGILPGNVPRLAEARIDRVVLAFTSVISLLGGLIFTLFPAFQGSRLDLQDALKAGGRGALGGGHRLRGALVVGEMALAMTLLIGAGLLLHSLWRVLEADPGFSAERLTTMQISLSEAQYGRRSQVAGFYTALLERTAALPGVEACGVTSTLPISGNLNRTLMVPADRPPPPSNEIPIVEFIGVSSGYFQAMGIPLRSGRWFNERDVETSESVTIVDATLAERFWPGQDAVGRQMRYGGSADSPAITVVGVVGHVKNRGVDADSGMQMYAPYGQTRFNSLALVVRTRADSDPTSAVRATVRQLDAEVPISNVRAMDQVIGEHNASRQASAMLLGGFAASALLLAAVGLYGVLAYAVAQRTQEIGIRMALGARRADVLGLVLGHGMRLTLAGVVLGWIGSLALARFLGGFLFGVQPVDPATFTLLSAVLAGVAFVACYLPARRAATTDPMVALRYE